jgi:hypothetical protein
VSWFHFNLDSFFISSIFIWYRINNSKDCKRWRKIIQMLWLNSIISSQIKNSCFFQCSFWYLWALSQIQEVAVVDCYSTVRIEEYNWNHSWWNSFQKLYILFRIKLTIINCNSCSNDW